MAISERQSRVQGLRNVLMNGKEMIETRFGKKSKKGIEDLISYEIFSVPYEDLHDEEDQGKGE